MKILIQHLFGRSVPRVEFYQDELEVLLVRSPILYFFLLVLKIPLNLGPDIGYKRGRFFEALSEKGFEFVPNKGSGPIALNFGLILLLMEVDLIPEEQGCKRNELMARGTNRVEIILALSTKVVALHMQTPII